MKKYLIVGVGLLVLGIGWTLTNDNLVIEIQKPERETLAAVLNEEETKQLLKPIGSTYSDESTKVEIEELIRKEKLVEEVNLKVKFGGYQTKEYLKERGFSSQEDRDIYESYDTETLKALVAAGDDFIANQTLAMRFYEQDKLKEFRDTLLMSAAHNDIRALQAIAIKESLLLYSVKTGELSREQALDVIGLPDYNGDISRAIQIQQQALFLVEKIRGGGDYDYVSDLLNKKGAAPFSEAENNQAKELAFNIYSSLVKQREALGLDEFDNALIGPHVDLGLEPIFSEVYKEYLAKK